MANEVEILDAIMGSNDFSSNSPIPLSTNNLLIAFSVEIVVDSIIL